MRPIYDDFLIKRFEEPDGVRTFGKGKFEAVKIGLMTRLRRGYGAGFCEAEHYAQSEAAKIDK